MKKAESRLLDLNFKTARADWVKSTFITEDTENLSAEANDILIAATTELAEQARAFEGQQLSPDLQRKIKLLKLSLTLPAPKDPAERNELTNWRRRWKASTARVNIVPRVKKANA
jgi:peptidyl-dipeptidase A